MAEIFQAARRDQSTPSHFVTVESRNLDWADCGANGFWIKSLHHDKATGQKTLLMKVDPGAYSASHSHDQIEQIYVIAGTFYDQTRTYAAGDFVLREPGANHTAGSKDGALVMLIYVAG